MLYSKQASKQPASQPAIQALFHGTSRAEEVDTKIGIVSFVMYNVVAIIVFFPS